MAQKEFKRLNRAELIEVIYQLQLSEQKLQTELAYVKSELESKNLKIAEAGSIAEAVIGLSGIFEKAQAAADQYLQEVYTANTETETRCSRMLAAASRRANAILQQAQEEGNLRKEQADREIEKKWAAFRAKTDELLRIHGQLRDLLGNDR